MRKLVVASAWRERDAKLGSADQTVASAATIPEADVSPGKLPARLAAAEPRLHDRILGDSDRRQELFHNS